MSEIVEQQKERTVEFISGLIDKMGVDGTVTAREEEDKIIVDIACDDSQVLIGRRGQVIDAIQHLATKVAFSGLKRDEGKALLVDADGYRQKQIERLQDLATRMRDRAVESGEKVHLKPMNSYDRRIVHMTLADDEQVDTASEGERDDRHICIVPKA